MEAKELRMGNLVLTGGNVVLKIEGIISKGNTGGYLLETLKPIPITEEWLLKFGLKQFMKKEIYQMYDIPIELIKKDDENWFLSYKNIDIVIIKYIHQLQNLYFALTSKELE